MTYSYANPPGGLPPQTQITRSRAVFNEAYVVIPRGVMTDIVTSNLPHWDKTRVWVLARPLSGLAETFAQYIVEVAPGGGSTQPEPDPEGEGVLFVTAGRLEITVAGIVHDMDEGGYAYLPPSCDWSVSNPSESNVTFHWIRKRYESVPGISAPEAFVTNENEIASTPMPDCDGRWATKRFVDTADIRHDMHVNIVSFEPGGVIPFPETHVMEHGLYVLEGKAIYLLNQDWVEVEAGDFMWLRAFCPQACHASGPGRFRYLLYKDVNRHPRLG
ncbi:bifunctional allantoicase/(S)-ureidoglycine aminohydrolase [Cognatishimia maritima]|uniref:(S)-ureidoglycine aminohydrolase n=1 Tax=Cognatishimia maritima TaxID=870908 RepID=A0A1M5U662_9RHOB|nr:bifunctional allantoicase/(S)-ureidoglycine aminohydrolase [Cognatishimia maritima]SHH58390.1 (S)-ureidoglycine aminohydrolase [Cognatishimia maritima]